MANRNKAKGSAWERGIRDFCRAKGLFIDRKPAGASLDTGDHSLRNWTTEAKDCARIDLAGFIDEAVVEQANGGTLYHIVLMKRRGKGDPGEGYATMTIAQWVRIVLELEELDDRRNADRRLMALSP